MLIFLLSLILAASLSPCIIWLYRWRGWVDDPSQNTHVKRTHRESVPRGGGLVVFPVIVVLALLFLHVDQYLVGILSGAFILLVVGTLDDIFDLNPFLRLFAGLFAALLVVGSGIGIAYVTNPFGAGVIHLNYPQLSFNFLGSAHTIWIVADLFALLFITWNMNIVNWSKGVDGQMSGFVSIALVFVALLSQRFDSDPTQFNVAQLSLIVAGAYAGLTLWNFFPQKNMPGYGGGSIAGFFLAVLAILSGAKVATLLMVLAIPSADAVFTIARRVLAGKSPFWGDRGHLHHKLMDVLGWGRRRIAFFYWGSSLGLGMISLYLNTWGKIFTLALTTTFVFGFLIWAKLQQLKPRSHS